MAFSSIIKIRSFESAPVMRIFFEQFSLMFFMKIKAQAIGSVKAASVKPTESGILHAAFSGVRPYCSNVPSIVLPMDSDRM
jgi:hypothetical protein